MQTLFQILQEFVEMTVLNNSHRHLSLGELHTAVIVGVLPIAWVAGDHHP